MSPDGFETLGVGHGWLLLWVLAWLTVSARGNVKGRGTLQALGVSGLWGVGVCVCVCLLHTSCVLGHIT